MQKNNSPAAAGTAGTGVSNTKPAQRSATLLKWQRVLGALVDGRTLNRFEAARELRDWCLNTTISQLEDRGLKILRKEESVPGAFGPVRCCRYWLADESVELARTLLGLSRSAP